MRITNFIKKLKKAKPVLFTTPGHSQEFFSVNEFKKVFGEKIFSCDFSEIEGMDNLQDPQGIIKESLQEASEIYGSESSFYLINGSSSGIIALILATVKRGEKILLSRNVHKSVINALVLSGAYPVWIEPEWNTEWNIAGSINPEKITEALSQNPDINSVLLTNPTYEGVITDLNPIAEICRSKNITLLIDEAHGALWNFSERLPTSSIYLGADACVQSLHKTGSCLNQGALLHIAKDSKLTGDAIQRALNLINTTSPSYLLLSSIESSVKYLNSKQGREKLEKLLDNIEETKNILLKNTDIEFLQNNDPTKIMFKLPNICGQTVSDFLEDEYNIEVELNNNKALLALTGIGTCRKKLLKLAKGVVNAYKKLLKSNSREDIIPYISPQTLFSPAEAFYAETETVPVNGAIDRISAETIVNYPPGIPVLIAGEVIQQAHLVAMKGRREIKVVKKS